MKPLKAAGWCAACALMVAVWQRASAESAVAGYAAAGVSWQKTTVVCAHCR